MDRKDGQCAVDNVQVVVVVVGVKVVTGGDCIWVDMRKDPP